MNRISSSDHDADGKIFYRTRSSLNLNNPRYSDGLYGAVQQDAVEKSWLSKFSGKHAAAAVAAFIVAALVVWLVEARELRRTAAVRAGAESAGCDGAAEPEDPPAG